MRPTLRAALAAALLLALALAGAAAAGNGGFAPVEPASPNAEGIRDAYWLIFALTAGVFVLVEGALVFFMIRFRSRRRPREVEGPQIRGNSNLEIAWTVVPVLILAAIAGFVFYKLPGITDVPEARAGDVRVRVVAKQYSWQFEYPGGKVSIDRMVVPVGRVVTLDVVASDVVHSWWIPSLGGKIDAIPGRTNHTWFQATRLGTFRGQCAELCGTQHTLMKARVEVVSESGYRSFLAAHSPGSQAVGEETWAGACAKCHGLAGQGDNGPPIAGSPILTDPEALERVVRNGVAPARTMTGMPAVGSDWPDAQIAALARYVRGNPTLGRPPGGG